MSVHMCDNCITAIRLWNSLLNKCCWGDTATMFKFIDFSVAIQRHCLYWENSVIGEWNASVNRKWPGLFSMAFATAALADVMAPVGILSENEGYVDQTRQSWSLLLGFLITVKYWRIVVQLMGWMPLFTFWSLLNAGTHASQKLIQTVWRYLYSIVWRI